MRKGVMFYEEELRTLHSMSNEQRGLIFDAIIADILGEELPELSIMETAVYNLINGQVKRAKDLSEKRSEAAKVRWDKNKNFVDSGTDNTTVVQNDTIAMQNNANACTNTNTNTNTVLSASADNIAGVKAAAAKSEKKPVKKPKAEKVQFAEFVSMTNEEYNSLVTELGEQGAKRCIEILDNYKGAKNKKYANDYRAIHSWVIKRYKEEKCETHNQPQSATETTNADKVDRKTLEKKYGDAAVSKYEAKFDNWSSKHGSVKVEKYSEIAKWMANDNIPEVPKSRSSFDVDEVMNKIYAKYREDEKHDN